MEKAIVPPEKKPYQEIGDDLRAQIAQGRYPVGSRLPPERHIAETYGVSRTIVREALLMLELQGTVDIRQGSGVYVMRIPHENDSEEEQLLSSDVGPFEILQARQLLESNIAAFAAKMATRADIDNLKRIVEQEQRAIALNDTAQDNARLFHLVLAGAIISIMLNPVLFTLLEKYLDKTETLDEQTLEEVLEDEKQVPVDICNHALLVGFGRVGSLLGEKLMAQGIPLVVVETSRTRVDELRERGISAVLGNAANEEIMELAHLDCARWLLLTIPNGYEAGEIVASAREKCPNIEIIARAHYDDEVDYIIDRGANQVVMGEREIARAMLRLLETPPAGEVVTG